MRLMFYGASSFRGGDLTSWRTKSLTSLYYTFYDAVSFMGDISTWDVSRVDSLEFTFRNCPLFDSDVSQWNVGRVTTLRETFAGAMSFTSSVSLWDVSNVMDTTRTVRMLERNKCIQRNGSLDRYEMKHRSKSCRSLSLLLQTLSVCQCNFFQQRSFELERHQSDICNGNVGQCDKLQLQLVHLVGRSRRRKCRADYRRPAKFVGMRQWCTFHANLLCTLRLLAKQSTSREPS
jgi:surface protein